MTAKPKLFYNNRLRDAQEGNDGTEYAACSAAMADPDDAFKVRGSINLAADVSSLSSLIGCGIEFDDTENKYRITDASAVLSRLQSLDLIPAMAYARALCVVDSYMYVACTSSPSVIVKINLVDFSISDSIVLNYGENAANALANSGNDLYVACGTDPTIIVKINLSTFTRTAALTLSAGEQYSFSLAVYSGFLYAGCNTSPATIVKIRLSDFTRTAALALSAGENNSYAMVVYGSNLFVGCNTSPAIVVKVNLGTFTRTTARTLNAGENNIRALAVYGTDVYAACYVSPAIIVKVATVAMTRTAALTLNAGENNARALAVYGTNLYVACETADGIIVKMDPAAMTRTSALTLNAGEEDSVCLAVYGTDLYVGCDMTTAIIVKMDPAAMTRTSALTLNTGEVSAASIAASGTDLYIGCDTVPAVIVKIDLNTFTRTAALTLNAGESYARALAVYGAYLYAGCYTAPAVIVKIDLDTFTRTDALTLGAGENEATALAVYGSDLYVCCETTATQIVKVDLGTFTRTEAVTLAAGEDEARALVVSGTNLYVGCYTAPSIVVKIDLVAFTRTSARTLNAGEDNIRALAVYGTDLYAACYVSPAIIVKVATVAMTRTAALTLNAGENLATCLVVYGGDLFVGCYVFPGIIVKVNLALFTRSFALTLNSGEDNRMAIVESGDYLYTCDNATPAASIQKLDPVTSFTLFERLQTVDIGDSFSVRAGLTCASEADAAPMIYAADGHISPRGQGTVNTALLLRCHAPNYLEDGGFESGTLAQTYRTAGANWAINTANKLIGAYSVLCDFSTNDPLIWSVTKKLEAGKTYRLIFKADSLTAAISAGAITIAIRQAGSLTPPDSTMTGTQPVITTDANWVELEFTPAFSTNNWQLVITPNLLLKGTSTGVILDEFYLYDKKTLNSLWAAGHNLGGRGRILVTPRRFSGLRTTAHDAPAFARASIAYDSSGTQHLANILRYETGWDGKANGAALIEEATTNLLSEKQWGVETDDTEFAASVGCAITRVNTYAWEGSWSLKVEFTGGAATENAGTTSCVVNPSVNNTGSFWIYAPVACTARIEILEYTAADVYVGVTTSPDIVLPVGWSRHEITRLFGVTGEKARVRVRQATVPAAFTVYVDGWQIEEKAYATHSQSPAAARVEDNLTIPSWYVFGRTTRSIAFRFKSTSKPVSGRSLRPFFYYIDATNNMSIRINATGNLEAFVQSGASYLYTAAAVMSQDTWYHIALTFDGTKFWLYADGVLLNAAGTSYVDPVGYASFIRLGHSSNSANGLIDDLQIFNRVLTAAEIAALYAAADPRLLDSFDDCVWHQDFNNAYDSGGFEVDEADEFLKYIPTSDWPCIEVTVAAVASYTPEIGELYVGDYWEVPNFVQKPVDPYRTNKSRLKEYTWRILHLDPALRKTVIEYYLQKCRDGEAFLVQWDTDAPVLVEDFSDSHESPYNPYLNELTIKARERQ